MSIFKYFTEEAHARALIQKGVMLFRPLAFFRAYEDGQIRGDTGDAVLVYAPTGGLEITKQDGTVLKLEGWRFTSSAKDEDIFVYCASNRLCVELSERFQSPFCVEISEPGCILDRLTARAHPTSELDYKQLITGSVDYRKPDAKPDADWAVPEKLVLIKPYIFAWQDEFRIAVGKWAAFEVHNVECKLESGKAKAATARVAQAGFALRVGSLADVAKLHRF